MRFYRRAGHLHRRKRRKRRGRCWWGYYKTAELSRLSEGSTRREGRWGTAFSLGIVCIIVPSLGIVLLLHLKSHVLLIRQYPHPLEIERIERIERRKRGRCRLGRYFDERTIYVRNTATFRYFNFFLSKASLHRMISCPY